MFQAAALALAGGLRASGGGGGAGGICCAATARAATAALCRRSAAAGTRALSSTAVVSQEQQPPQRERMEYDVCIVGAGPAGLAAAIRFKQVCCAALRCVICDRHSWRCCRLESDNTPCPPPQTQTPQH